jgi:glycolate oxidase FAD binding subunit
VVVFPESRAEAQAVLQAAARAGLAVLPAGRATHIGIGMPPRQLDCVVSMARLNRIIEHTAADMTVTVEPGATVAELNAALAVSGQWLPIDPPLPSATTVGGLVAGNLNGLLRAAHGGVRDMLIGLRMLRPDGVTIKSGGRVVKNVAGYDLHKAFVGSYGTLGIIVEATFKVRPAPAVREVVVIPCSGPVAAARVMDAIRNAPIEPRWCALASAGVTAASDERSLAVVGLGASPRSLAAERERILALIGPVARADAVIARDDASAGPPGLVAVYTDLRDFPARPGPSVMCTLTVLPSDMARFVELLSDAAAWDDVSIRFVVEPFVTRFHIALAAEELKPLAKTISRLRTLAKEAHGHLMLRRATPELKRLAGVWGDIKPPVARLMERLKMAFDPGCVLCAGRFVADL